jgi:hypothetical protein
MIHDANHTEMYDWYMLLTIQVQFYKYESAANQSKQHYTEPSSIEHDQMTTT